MKSSINLLQATLRINNQLTKQTPLIFVVVIDNHVICKLHSMCMCVVGLVTIIGLDTQLPEGFLILFPQGVTGSNPVHTYNGILKEILP